MDQPPLPPAPIVSEKATVQPSKMAPIFGIGSVTLQLKKSNDGSNAEFSAERFDDVDGKWKLSPTQLMRYIDRYRMYTPTEAEINTYNIPPSRLDLHQLISVLVLCGGNAMARFSSEEIVTLREWTLHMAPLYTEIDALYKRLVHASKTFRLKGGPYPQYTSVQFKLWEAQQLLSQVTDTPTTCDIILAEDFGAQDVIYFHVIACSYIDFLRRLQTIVREKRTSLVIEVVEKARDADDSVGIGTKFPRWLTVLIEKYTALVRLKEADLPPSSTAPRKLGITHGKLAAFISCCILGRIECDGTESDAIAEVSTTKACFGLFSLFMATFRQVLEASTDAASLDEATWSMKRTSQEYWADRMFAFLTKLGELKVYPSDQASKYNFELFL